jgi:tyrosine-protein kinase Etk/Wzc
MTLQTSYTIESEAPQEILNTAQLSELHHEVSLIEVLTQLAYRKRLIAKVTGVAILVGLVLAFALPVRYTATTKLMPPQQTQSSASLMMSQLSAAGGGSLAAIAGGGLGLKSPNDIYIGLLTSRTVADSIISRFDLTKEYRARDMTEARKDLEDFTQVTSEKNGFISVSVTDKDKNQVAAMANAYTAELRTLIKTLAVTEASQRRLFYEDQLKQAKDALILAELAFQQVQQEKGLVQLDAQAKTMIESLAALRAQVAAKQVEVQALRSYSTERNPDLELAERELATLQAEVGRLEQRNHSSGSTELGLQDVPGAVMEYLRADHEVRYRQALFDLLIKQYDAARLDEAKDAAIIQVVEPAIEPDKKTSPKRALIVILSSFVGIFLGSLLALFQWWSTLVNDDPALNQQLRQLRFALSRKA